MSRILPTRSAFTKAMATLTGLCALTVLLALCVSSQGVNFYIWQLNTDTLLGLRLLRLLQALLCGAALAAAGSALQALLKNPLADPYALGISGSASMFTAVTLMFMGSLSAASLLMASIAGALCATLFLLYIAYTEHMGHRENGILVGVALNAVAAAMISLARIWLPPEQNTGFLYWMMGGLSYPTLSELGILSCACIVGIILLLYQRGILDLLALGDIEAMGLGVSIRHHKLLTYLGTSILIGATVSSAGMISFVGLIVPQTLRRLLCADQKILLPASILGGATFLLLCDTCSRLSYLFLATEIPVGAVTAFIGAPVFIILLVKQRRDI